MTQIKDFDNKEIPDPDDLVLLQDAVTGEYLNSKFSQVQARGLPGLTPNFSIGEVDALPFGSPATASITGTNENPILNLGIPEGKSAIFSREVVSITTPLLNPGETHNTTIPLGKSFLLLSVNTNLPAWLRLYTSPNFRAIDANRPIFQSVATLENGIISEDITIEGALSITFVGNSTFKPIGASTQTPPSENIAIAITNSGKSPQIITANYNRILLES